MLILLAGRDEKMRDEEMRVEGADETKGPASEKER